MFHQAEVTEATDNLIRVFAQKGICVEGEAQNSYEEWSIWLGNDHVETYTNEPACNKAVADLILDNPGVDVVWIDQEIDFKRNLTGGVDMVRGARSTVRS